MRKHMLTVFCTILGAVFGSAIIANASVDSDTYDSVQKAWAKVIYDNTQYKPGEALPNITTPFSSVEEGYNLIKPYAFDSKPKGNGYYPTGQTATLDGDPTETSSTQSVAGSETLTNDLDTTTNLLTNSLTYTVTNGTTIDTTNAFNLGISNSASFDIFFVKDGMTVSANYNFSKSDTQTDTHTVSYKIPSQSIPVKPGHTVVVDYVMTLGKATGNLNINANLTGNSPIEPPLNAIKYGDKEFYNLGTILQGFDTKDSFSYDSPNSVSYTGGHATYSASIYSNTQLRVYDQTSGETTLYALNRNNKAIIN